MNRHEDRTQSYRPYPFSVIELGNNARERSERLVTFNEKLTSGSRCL